MFKPDKFMRAEFSPRTEQVKVPSLAAFFGDGDDPVWEVRGLDATELHKALEASRRQDSVESIVRAVAQTGDQAEAVRKALGLTKDTPGEMAKRLEMLVAGSVAPAIDLPLAVKLAETFPIEFLTLTNTITTLTGLGYDLVKPHAASRQTTA